MPQRPYATGKAYVTALSLRGLLHRYSFILFVIMATVLLLVGKIQPATTEAIRGRGIDAIVPVLDAISRPITTVQTTLKSVEGYFNLRSENDRLRAEVAEIKQWQNSILSLEQENEELHHLLNFKTEPGVSYISARVIADTGAPFVQGMIVTAGKVDGVREGMAAMSGEGLIGRVVEVGDWSSRILLITDLNSRIPVSIVGSRDRAILAGDNSMLPHLLYLPQDTTVSAGARVVTSGHGGVFPPNLPVGNLLDTKRGSYSVMPVADISRINYVRLIDFNLKGGAFNPLSSPKPTPAKSKR